MRALALPVQLAGTAVMVWACLALALQCLSPRPLKIARRTAPLPAGESFTAAMGLRAALWAAGALALAWAFSLLRCAMTREEVTFRGLLELWRQWDANNFLRIAELGYRGFETEGMHTTLVFYPLYPWLMRALHLIIPDWAVCGHLISCACYIGAAPILARTLTEDFGRRTARLALGLLSCYPFAFFFGAVFSESLFLLLSAAGFACIRRRRWLPAGLLGALAALTRMQGALLLAVGLVEYCAAERPVGKLLARDWRGLVRDGGRVVLPLAVTLAGVGIYLAVNWAVDGDPFRFVYYEKAVWHQGFAPMPRCLGTICEYLVKRWGERQALVIWGPELAIFLVCAAALVWAPGRMPPAWTAYLAGCTALNYSLSWPLSCGRYMACAFPLFAALALLFRRRPAAGWIFAAAMALLQAAFLTAYLAGWQVM